MISASNLGFRVDGSTAGVSLSQAIASESRRSLLTVVAMAFAADSEIEAGLGDVLLVVFTAVVVVELLCKSIGMQDISRKALLKWSFLTDLEKKTR